MTPLLLTEYRARVIAAAALLTEEHPATSVLRPLVDEAYRNIDAIRKATQLLNTAAPSDAGGCFEATAGDSPAASPGA